MSNSWQSKGWGLAESYDRKLRGEQREPVKFEAGQVLTWRDTSVGVYLVNAVETDYIRCARLDNGDMYCGFQVSAYGRHFDVRSPSPRAGDTWTSGESVARLELCAHGDTSLRIVSEGEPFVGDVVAVARRLWEGGYRKVLRVKHGEPAPRDIAKGETIEVEIPLVPWSETQVNPRAAHEKQVRLCNDAIAYAILGDAARTCDDPPRAGEYWKNATTMIVLRECLGGLHTCVIASEERWPMQHIGNAEQTAEFLRENGYRRASEQARMTAQNAPRLGEFKWQTAYDDRVRDCIAQCVERGDSVGDAARNVQRILDSLRVDRATGDDLRKIAELHGVPELRAGMVVRREPCENLKRVVFGRVLDRHGTDVRIHWLGDSGPWHYASTEVADFLHDGRWRIVTPDVAPLASLANAVAAIFERPDIATSRRTIDIAIATLRGEPFARAIAAVLVGVAERTALAPVEIAALVRGARAHERRRSEVAPGIRSLTAGQFDACWAAAHYESESQWSRRLSEVYERARPL